MLNNDHINLIVFWVLYCFIHSLMASFGFKQYIKYLTGNFFKWYRLVYSILAIILLAALLVYQYHFQSIFLFHPPLIIKISAAIAAVMGMFVMIVSIRKYFFLLSGIAVFKNKTTGSEPLRNGLNAYMRHPLYAGNLLVIWSLFCIYPLLNNLIACCCITLYLLIGIQLEEKKLIQEYGEMYQSYRKKVPMLLPLGLLKGH